MPPARTGSTICLYGEARGETASIAPSDIAAMVSAHGVAVDALIQQADHPGSARACDVHFGARVVEVLSAAEQSLANGHVETVSYGSGEKGERSVRCSSVAAGSRSAQPTPSDPNGPNHNVWAQPGWANLVQTADQSSMMGRLADAARSSVSLSFRQAMLTETHQATAGAQSTGLRLIDADIHVEVPRADVLFPYLAEHWIEHIKQSRFKGPSDGDSPYPPQSPVAARPGTRPGNGPAGSDLDLLCSQALEQPRVDLAIANCSYAIDSIHHPDAAVALASAVNDWLIGEWLDKEPRLRASMVVPSQLPELAAREIDRVGGHPGFVQVYLPVRAQHPYGTRLFRPMWDAIVRRDLVAGIHFGGAPGNPPTPSGWPSYYFEEYAGMAQVFASQLTSLINEGVFDQWPTARVTLIEAGWTWLPPHLWRYDKEWRNLRMLVPWVKRAPSAYVREHMRFTIQPIDAPTSTQQLLEVVEELESDELLLYASDYPHLHHADPLHFLNGLPHDLGRKVASENARAWYRL